MEDIVIEDSLTLDLNEYLEDQSFGNPIILPGDVPVENYDSDVTCLSVESCDVGLHQAPLLSHVSQSQVVEAIDCLSESQDSNSIIPPSQLSLFSTIPETPANHLKTNNENYINTIQCTRGLSPNQNTTPIKRSEEPTLATASKPFLSPNQVTQFLQSPIETSNNSTPSLQPTPTKHEDENEIFTQAPSAASPLTTSDVLTHSPQPNSPTSASTTTTLADIFTQQSEIPKTAANDDIFTQAGNVEATLSTTQTTLDDIYTQQTKISSTTTDDVFTQNAVDDIFTQQTEKPTTILDDVFTQKENETTPTQTLIDDIFTQQTEIPTSTIDDVFTQVENEGRPTTSATQSTIDDILTQQAKISTPTKNQDTEVADCALLNYSSNDDDCIIVDPPDSQTTSGKNEKRKIVENKVEKTKRHKRKKRIKFTQPSQFSLSQVRCDDIEEPPYSNKLHLKQMEELNIIQAKISSVKKVLAMKQKRYYGNAEHILKGEVRKRIEKIKDHLYDKQSSSESDSEQKRDHSQLLQMRENRLEAILVARDKLVEELEQMGRCDEEDEDESIESSQSILPVNVPLYKSFTVKLPTSTTTTKQSMKRGFRHIQLPNKNTKTTSTRPIIYIVPNSCTTQKGTAMPVISRVKNPQIHHVSHTPQPTKIKFIQHSNNQHHALTNKPISTLPTPSCITPRLISNPENRFVNLKAPKPILLTEITQPKSFSPIFQALSQSGIPNIPMPTHMLPTTLPNTIQHTAQADIQQDKLDLNLSYLLKNKIIQQGSNVLKLKSMGREHVASLTSNGSILTSEFQLYVTPVAWIKGVTGRSYSKVNAFKMVTYLDEPLYNISMRVAQKTQAAVMPQQQTTFDDVRMTSTPQKSPVGDLVGFLMSCKIRLVQNDEFFITSQLCARHGGDEFEMMKHYIDTDW
ncbi:uncharacterized protein LOC144745017 [Ciona intestinalis]